MKVYDPLTMEHLTTRFLPLLELSVRHSYYPDGRCGDFAIEPSPETERLVRNHRLVLRERPDGLRVVAPVDTTGRPFITLAADVTFTWYLRLRNPDFALITDERDLVAHRTPRYRNTGPVEAELLVPDENPAPDQLPPGVFATVEITPGTSSPLTADPRAFIVSFEAASAWWSYYLVTDIPAEQGAFSLVDTSSSPIEFDADDVRDLVADPDPTDEVALKLAARHPAGRRLRFRSDGPVPSRSEPRHRLELRLADERVAGPLPIPRPSSLKTVPIDVGGSVEHQPALSHIVRYPDRSTANNGV